MSVPKIHNKMFYDKLILKTQKSDECLLWQGTKTVRLPKTGVTVTFRRAMVYAVLGKMPVGTVNIWCFNEKCINFDHFKFFEVFNAPGRLQAPRDETFQKTVEPELKKTTRKSHNEVSKEQIFQEYDRIVKITGKNLKTTDWQKLASISYLTVLRKFKRWKIFLWEAESRFRYK